MAQEEEEKSGLLGDIDMGDIKQSDVFKLLTQISARYQRAKKRLNEAIRDIDKQVEE